MTARPLVLVLEDDPSVRAVLRLVLADDGYDVVEFEDADSALRGLDAHRPDAMVVDLMLGATDGFAFIAGARTRSTVPVVVVSARQDTHDVVAALEVGADDYLTKPFVPRELTARLKALRRRDEYVARSLRAPDDDRQVLRGEPDSLVVDHAAGRVLRRGEPLHLTLTEFRLLQELARSAGQVLSRQALLDRVWDRGFFGDERIVDVHIRRLRTKVEQDPDSPALVVTVRGLGYRLDGG